MEPADVSREAVTAGRLLLADYQQTPASAKAARYTRAAGVPKIIDVEKVPPGIADLLEATDVLIAAQEFPTLLTGDEELGRALEVMGPDSSASVGCMTPGEQGSLAWYHGREIRMRPRSGIFWPIVTCHLPLVPFRCGSGLTSVNQTDGIICGMDASWLVANGGHGGAGVDSANGRR